MADVEPMDIDSMENEYENKENSILHSNVLPKTPCTEKGYEELDVSELNMKLRYSITPASSPMSRSYTANCRENKIFEDFNTTNIANADLTSSLNSTLTNNDMNKSNKLYPLQTLSTDNLNDMNRNVLILKSTDDNNVTITVNDNIDENFSIPSTSSSIPHTPEATTPTKELPKDGGSPIMRGLRSVLSMFKPSQSLRSPHEMSLQEGSSSIQVNTTTIDESELNPIEVSTPLHITNRTSPLRSSPLKDSLVFNDDLEKELQWKDDSTILFKEEKIPKHKLYLQDSVASNVESKILNKTTEEGNKTIEYMDVSYNDTIVNDRTMNDVETKPCLVLEGGLESDGEFVDCETTYTKDESKAESLINSVKNVNLHNNKTFNSASAAFNSSDNVEHHLQSSTLSLPDESLNLTADKNVETSKISNKDISAINFTSENVLQETETSSQLMLKDLCQSELPANSDFKINNTPEKNCNNSNIEINKLDILEVANAVGDLLQTEADQTKGLTNVAIKNEFNSGLRIETENQLDSINKNSVSETITIAVSKDNANNYDKEHDDVFSNIHDNETLCSNNLISDVEPTLCLVENNIASDDRKNVEAIDLNIKGKVNEVKGDTNCLLQTVNNSESNQVNVSNKVSKDNCSIILSQNNIESIKYTETTHEVDDNENVENDPDITVQNSECNEKNPFNIPLPTDNDFDDIIKINDSNKISSNVEYKVNEVFERNKVNNVNKSFDEIYTELPNITKPIVDTDDKIIDQINCIINYETKSKQENIIYEVRENQAISCNKAIEKDNSFETINKNERIDKLDLMKSEERKEIKSYKMNESINKNAVDNVVNINSQPLQASNMSITHELTENQVSLQCDTDNNIKNLNEKDCLNMEPLSNPFETKSKLQKSPPLSPMMSKKSYNINFNDIDDPFATKTKIRLSPTPDISDQDSLANEKDKTRRISPNLSNSNKRKSHPIRKPVNTKKNSLNATFDHSIKEGYKENMEKNETTLLNTKKENTCNKSFNQNIQGLSIEMKNTENNPVSDTKIDEICVMEKKDESLFPESVNLSPAKDITKSVFNCPEINDINFSSVSKNHKKMTSNLMMSPADIMTCKNEEFHKPKIDSLESITDEVINQEFSNVDSETSKGSKNIDGKEINTEDEDTATFNETAEIIEDVKESAGSAKDLLTFEISNTAPDCENVDNGEMFIDAEAFEFLLNQNKSNIISDSGKESLFLKFDPLFTKRVSSDGIIAALKRAQNNQSTPKKISKLQLENLCEMPGSSQEEMVEDITDDASIQTLTKPMMVVNPAINSIVSPRKIATPKTNRQSLTFTSPAMAVIDRLLSLSSNNLTTDNHNTSASSPARQHTETDFAITQLREMLADKDIQVHNLRSESKELKDRLSNLEAQVKTLEVESAERLKKVNDLNERLLEKTKMNKSMATVVEEYERTIASLITHIEKEKKSNAEEKMILIKERDEQTAHLASMEVSFNDLHSKYEKSKQVIYSMKANEETYKKSIQEFEDSLTKMQNNYELLKQHATSKLNHANLELEKFNRAHEAEVLKLNALIKRKELHITSLEETLAQKTKANEELTAICDELINKVG